MTPWSSRAAALVPLLLLAACGKSADGPAPVEKQVDPAAARALGAPLLTDPDLTSQNRADAVVSAGEPPVAEIPPDKRTPEEAAAAREQALALAGNLPDAPRASASDAASPARTSGSAAMLAQTQLGVSASCAASVRYSAIWAARMPLDLPVYPRAHLLEGAGADGGGCSVRVLRFITPVEVRDVLAFYNALAAKAGYRIERRTAGADEVLTGNKANSRLGLWVRRRGDGVTEADFGISGGISGG